MKLSRHLRVDDALKLKKWHLLRIKSNRPAKGLFILCTPKREGALFEIIATDYLTKRYEDVCVVAVSHDRAWIVEQVVTIVDALYATKTLTYEEIKDE